MCLKVFCTGKSLVKDEAASLGIVHGRRRPTRTALLRGERTGAASGLKSGVDLAWLSKGF